MSSSWIYLTLGVIVALIALGAVAINTAINQNVISGSPDRIRALLHEEDCEISNTDKQLIDMVLNYPDVEKYSKYAYHVSWDADPNIVDGKDVFVVYVCILGKQVVKGDWTTGYTVWHTNNVIMIVTIDRTNMNILYIDIAKKPDDSYVLGWNNDDIKEVLGIVMQNSTVQELLNGKDWYVRRVHSTVSGPNCPYGSCHFVIIDKVNTHESLVATVNSATKKVIGASTTPRW